MPTLKESPAEASIASHKLMLRSGMIRQVTSGIYNWLPMGLKLLSKIENIVREEMNAIGVMEITMPCIQPVDLWQTSGRYGEEGELTSEMLKMTDRHNNELVFTPTAEEAITSLFGNDVKSYKEMPKSFYQITNKFRDEIRPRYGVMRSREFLMKDAYSFHMSDECALQTYEKMLNAYLKIYSRIGLKAIPVAADTGDMGGDYSHEFHIPAKTGESNIFYEEGLEKALSGNYMKLKELESYYAAEQEKHDKNDIEKELKTTKGIEVGHIFYLGDKYTKAMNVKVQNSTGKLEYPKMGCYGIGISRLVGAVIEACHNENGIQFPESVAPFDVLLINLKPGHEECDREANKLYAGLKNLGIDVLYDDTKESPGVKFARGDLIGIPKQVVIGPKGIEKGEVEFKTHTQKTSIGLESVLNQLSSS